jgi:ABC-type ATPase involved in cell division
MVRLDGLAERFLNSLSVVIRTGPKQLVKRFHRRALDLSEGVLSTASIRAVEPIP